MAVGMFYSAVPGYVHSSAKISLVHMFSRFLKCSNWASSCAEQIRVQEADPMLNSMRKVNSPMHKVHSPSLHILVPVVLLFKCHIVSSVATRTSRKYPDP